MILFISFLASLLLVVCWMVWWCPDARQQKFARELYTRLAQAKPGEHEKIHGEWVAEFRRRWPRG